MSGRSAGPLSGVVSRDRQPGPYVQSLAPERIGPVDYAAEHRLAFWTSPHRSSTAASPHRSSTAASPHRPTTAAS
ncbi:hypothetical protein ACWDV4_14610 [Micromonospora sp. NPDC003197]